MSDSILNKVATDVEQSLKPRSILAKAASVVNRELSNRIAFVDRDAEWQRVHSYIADALKDLHVLYAKLARLQGDFGGSELENLNEISEKVLDLGEQMSKFSREFSKGDLRMVQSMTFEGGQGQGRQPSPNPQSPEEPPMSPSPEEEPLEEAPPIGEGGEEEGEKVPVVIEGEGGPEEWAPEGEEEEETSPPKKPKKEKEE